MKYETVIGVEVHTELRTNTKMFSGAPARHAKTPNTCVSEIDMAFPGTLPSLNRTAVRYGVMICAALGCEVDPLLRFDRKNYTYPDLPKGYQITQYFHPLGRHGSLLVKTGDTERKIRIARVHLEEDTAKQFHKGDLTYLDFNRAGIPLAEIVSEPDLRSAEETALFVAELRNLLEFLGVSDAKMEEGSLRCDVNVSVRKAGEETYGVKCEIKNLNSIADIRNAVREETKRQVELLEKGMPVRGMTLRYDEASGKNAVLRPKEETVDYKYFPDPNIPPVRLAEEFLEDIRKNMPELPQKKKARYMSGFGLSEYEAGILTSSKGRADRFEKTLAYTKYPKIAAKLYLGDIAGMLREQGISMEDAPFKEKDIADLATAVGEGRISNKQAKDLLPEILKGKTTLNLIAERGIQRVADEQFIREAVGKVLRENQKTVQDYRSGKDRALGFLVGKVLKETKGRADPAYTHQLVKEEIDNPHSK